MSLVLDVSVLQVNTVIINQSVFDFYIDDSKEEGVFDIMDISFTVVWYSSFLN